MPQPTSRVTTCSSWPFGPLAFVLLTLALTIATIRSVVRPLQRVEVRARAVSEGWLDGSPLEPRGPDEIVVVTEAINDLTVNLNRLVAQTAAFAAGELDAPHLNEPLPGALGRSLHAHRRAAAIDDSRTA